jgi:transcriptional regulator with XRE-family HTH domain
MDVERKRKPALERRRLTRRLARLRQQTGFTQHEVAVRLRWSQSKVNRIESGDVSLSYTDLLALLKLYEVRDDATVGELTQMAEVAHKPSLPKISEIHSRAFRQYLEHETIADRLFEFENSYVPGLLQRPEYARTLLQTSYRISSLPPAEGREIQEQIDKKVEVRMFRQEILQEGGISKASFVLDEAVVRRMVGAELNRRSIMIDQLEHLKGMSHSPRVDLTILPFAAGTHLAMSGPFVVLEFTEVDDPPLLFLEYATGDFVTKDEQQLTQRFTSDFETLQAQGCRGPELEQLLDDAIAEMS